MSDDLKWLLLRNNSSFIVKKRNAPVFTREPGNLRNLNSFKYSGLANSKTIDISDSPNGIQITTRKAKAAPGAVAGAYAVSVIRPRSGGRRALGIASKIAKRGYRPDLRTAALARVSALIATQKEHKPAPAKRLRGNKAKAAAAAASS